MSNITPITQARRASRQLALRMALGQIITAHPSAKIGYFKGGRWHQGAPGIGRSTNAVIVSPLATYMLKENRRRTSWWRRLIKRR